MASATPTPPSAEISFSELITQRAAILNSQSKLIAGNLDSLTSFYDLFSKASPTRMDVVSNMLNRLLSTTLPSLIDSLSFDNFNTTLSTQFHRSQEQYRQYVAEAQTRSQQQILSRTLTLLENPTLFLPSCVRLVAQLKELDDAIVTKEHLQWLFLRHRDRIIQHRLISSKGLPASSTDCINLQTITTCIRDMLPNIVSQYRTIFTDGKPLEVYLLHRSISITKSINIGITQIQSYPELAKSWNAVGLMSATISKLGMDIVPVVENTFIHRACALAETKIDQATLPFVRQLYGHFVEKKEAYAIQTLDLDGGEAKTALDHPSAINMMPPIELSKFPVIARLANALVDLLNELTIFPLGLLMEPMTSAVVKTLEEKLTSCYKQIEDAVADPDSTDLLTNIREVVDTNLIPFLTKALASIFGLDQL